MVSFPEDLTAQRVLLDRALERLLPTPEGPSQTVARAMRHAVLSGGKRLRPLLAVSAYTACGGDGDAIHDPACALEFVHTYSLIHDDLPAMDDDDMRRGRPTVHRRFGEAAAVLAGDALLTLAFEILGSRPGGQAAALNRSEAVVVMAAGAGLSGMIGGQIADLEAQGHDVGPEALRAIHLSKTGALMAAGCEIGALHAGAGGVERRAFADFGRALGLAFQITDDLLDQSGTAEGLGKTPGKDRRAGKATYPALHGLEASQQSARELVAEATEGLRSAGLLTPAIEFLAGFAISRNA